MAAFIVIFCAMFALCYYIVLNSRIEELFKQGKIYEIRIAQVIISFICSYLITSGLMALVENIST